jgi:hypothetical protein
VDALQPSVRAFGEWPGRGCELVMVPGAVTPWVATLSVEARWFLQDGCLDDRLFLREHGVSFEDMASAIGNSFPAATMGRDLARALTEEAHLLSS